MIKEVTLNKDPLYLIKLIGIERPGLNIFYKEVLTKRVDLWSFFMGVKIFKSTFKVKISVWNVISLHIM